MVDPRPIKLDLDTERVLLDDMRHDMAFGQFRLDEGRTFVLDAYASDR